MGRFMSSPARRVDWDEDGRPCQARWQSLAGLPPPDVLQQEIIDHLEGAHPGIKDRLLDAKGIRRFVNLYLNEDDVRFLDGLNTPVKDTASTGNRASPPPPA